MGSLTAIAHRPWSKYLAWGPVMVFTSTLQFFTIFLLFLGKRDRIHNFEL